MKVKYLIAIIIGSVSAKAQNLVLNPSFEEYSDCPTREDQLFYAKNWINPSKSSPDYYNNCNGDSINGKTIVGIPYNFNGFKKAHNGNAYVGIASYSSVKTYREYIQTKLKNKLLSEHEYEFSFWISIADSSNLELNGINICFSENAKLISADIRYGGSILSSSNCGRVWCKFEEGYKKQNGWIQIIGKYTASGNEEYMTIGIFKEDDKKLKIKKIKKAKKAYMSYAYYFIDDIELIPK